MKKVVIGLLVVAVLVLLGFALLRNEGNVTPPRNNATSTEDQINLNDRDVDEISEDGDIVETRDIRVILPRSGAVVRSPIVIQGEARGPWYFEASFSGKLLDAQGNLITEFPVEAQSDWMTTDFVPFSTTVSWNIPVSGNGTLILENANPSGLPQNAKSVTVPIVFGSSNQTQHVNVYFSRSSDTTDCSVVFPVRRNIGSTSAVARSSLEELFRGPTATEVNQGYVTNIPSGVRIQSLEVRNGIAYADFNAALEEGVGGSCRVQAIRSQITETLQQFSTVQSVVISINGRTDDILQP